MYVPFLVLNFSFYLSRQSSVSVPCNWGLLRIEWWSSCPRSQICLSLCHYVERIKWICWIMELGNARKKWHLIFSCSCPLVGGPYTACVYLGQLSLSLLDLFFYDYYSCRSVSVGFPWLHFWSDPEFWTCEDICNKHDPNLLGVTKRALNFFI